MILILSIWIGLAVGGSYSWYRRFGSIDGAIILAFFIFAPIWGPLDILSNIEFVRKIK